MKITWLADVRELPNHGIVQEGGTYDLPRDVANNLIKQGLAESAKAKKQKKESE